MIEAEPAIATNVEADRCENVPGIEFPTIVVCSDGSHVFDFDGVARFHVRSSDKTISLFEVATDATSEALTHLLFDHVAPRILAGADELVIHASAVQIDGRLAVFLGDTGAGKSTLAASLDKAGHSLIGDDAVLVSTSDELVTGRSVYPSLRLYPESISSVLGNNVATSPMAHYSDKLRLDVSSGTTKSNNPIPLGAIFFLTDELSEGEVAVHTLNPTLACMGLVEHSFALDPNDAQGAASRLRKASAVARSIPGFELSYPWNFELLPKVQELVLSCMREDPGPPVGKTELDTVS